MVFKARCRATAAMVVVVASCFFMWFRRRVEESRSVTYGPMVVRDQHRINNLRYIYESDDVHCVNLLRMKMAYDATSKIILEVAAFWVFYFQYGSHDFHQTM